MTCPQLRLFSGTSCLITCNNNLRLLHVLVYPIYQRSNFQSIHKQFVVPPYASEVHLFTSNYHTSKGLILHALNLLPDKRDMNILIVLNYFIAPQLYIYPGSRTGQFSLMLLELVSADPECTCMYACMHTTLASFGCRGKS